MTIHALIDGLSFRLEHLPVAEYEMREVAIRFLRVLLDEWEQK